MILPETQHGSGEEITVRGQIRLVAYNAPQQYVDDLNYVEVALNLADAIQDLRGHAQGVREAKAVYDRLAGASGEINQHIHRLWSRLAVILHEADGTLAPK